MTENQMRHYIDAIKRPPLPQLDEGVIDSIKNWIKGLSDPVKRRGAELMKNLEAQLKNKYGAKVPDQVKKSNKNWVWSKLTYRDLYRYAAQAIGMDDADIDRALKNPIVNNNLKQVIKALPAGIDAPQLPLRSATMQNNTNIISPTIDKTTKEYVSKAIAAAIIDGLAYIEQEKDDKGKPAALAPSAGSQVSGDQPDSGGSSGGMPSSPDDIKAAIQAIRQGLAKVKGAAE